MGKYGSDVREKQSRAESWQETWLNGIAGDEHLHSSSVFSGILHFAVAVLGVMAVPFVEDWDLVQTLGEGAYGE